MGKDMECRLCCKSNPECSHNLFDANGQCTEVYEITVKYFDPMLFVEYDDDASLIHCAILCQNCWMHVKEFYEFQQNILSTQCGLSGRVKQLLEEMKEDESNNTSNCEAEECLQDSGDVKMEAKNDANKTEDCLDADSKECNDDSEVEFTSIKSSKQNKMPSRSRSHKESLRGRRERGKSSIKKDTKIKNNSSIDLSYNSAAKIRELDNFIAGVKPQLECDLCKQEFANYNSLRRHFSDHHDTKVFVVCCRKKFFRRYLLVDHLRLHVNPETFKCDICGAVSTSSRTLTAHKRFMHNSSKTWKCELCQRRFKNKSTLTRHKATHATGNKDFKCEQCERSYVFEFQLKTHINKVHNETKVCDQCGKTVNGVGALKQHLLQHSDTKLPKWPCDQCDAQLASHKGLKSHKLSFHNDGTTAFICKECGRITSSENALLRHKRYVHKLERKYQCIFCEKAFKRNSTLKEHIATHTGQHLYQCTHCPQTFNNNANMHKHRKRAHPMEWAESRQNRLEVPKVNVDSIVKEVVL